MVADGWEVRRFHRGVCRSDVGDDVVDGAVALVPGWLCRCNDVCGFCKPVRELKRVRFLVPVASNSEVAVVALSMMQSAIACCV